MNTDNHPSKRIVRLVSLGFFLVFLPFHAVERYVGAFFEEMGSSADGLSFLAIAYGSLFVGDFVSPMITARLGYRKSLALASVFYFLWIVSLTTYNMVFVTICSILAGFAAALLWNSMASCVIREGKEEEIGSNFGTILSRYGMGAGLGLLAMTPLLTLVDLKTSFMILAPVAILASVVFLRLPEMEKPPAVLPGDLAATYLNGTILRVATISVMAFLAFGLLVSVVPLHINQTLGLGSIGWLSSGAFFVLFLCQIFGKVVDEIGTKRLTLSAYFCLAAGAGILLVATNKTLVITGVMAICVAFAALFVIMLGLAELAPVHKIDSAQAVFTSADDITAFAMLAISASLQERGMSLDILYKATIGFTAFSLILVFPLFKGSTLEGAREKLEQDFPEPPTVEAETPA